LAASAYPVGRSADQSIATAIWNFPPVAGIPYTRLMSSTTEVKTKQGLVRGLRKMDLVALVLNSIVGAGIFGLPSQAFALAGAYSVLAYLVCAVPVLLIVSCFAEVSSRFSATGGLYIYAREAFGPVVGFEIGWLAWLTRLTGFAALCNLFADYTAYFFPALGSGFGRVAVIVGVVAGLTAANIAGLRTASWFGNVLTVAKLVPLLLLIAAGLSFINLHTYSQAARPSYTGFSASVLLLVFAFTGFEMVVIPAGEARDPRRHLPFALLSGAAAAVLLFVAIQAVCVGTVADLAKSQKPLADVGAHLFGTPGASLIAAGALVSVLGTMHVIMLSAPRLLFAMAEQAQLPQVVSSAHHRFQTPHVAILLSGAGMLALSLSGTFASAATLSTTIRLITYAVTCAALPILRRRRDVEKALFSLPAGDVVSAIAIVLVAWLLSSSAWREANHVFFAAVLGFVLYAVFAGSGSRHKRI
jgi:APA family basic amino acid/polyamine antiporter